MKRLVSYILIVTGQVLPAQEFRDDVRKMRDTYVSAKHLYEEMNVYFCYSDTDASGILQKHITYYKNGSSMLVASSDNIAYMDDSLRVYINHKSKTILYSFFSEKNSRSDNMFLPAFDSSLKQYDSIRYLGLTDLGKHYACYLSRNKVVKIEMYIDDNLNMLRKMIITYSKESKDTPYREIYDYPEISTRAEKSDKLKLSDYLTIKNKQVRPVKQYMNYRIEKM